MGSDVHGARAIDPMIETSAQDLAGAPAQSNHARQENLGLVSTIIPTFNRAEMLLRAVDSVLSQTYRPIEIVISDDGSTDDTPGIAAELGRNNPDVIRYVGNPNRGAGPAREAGRLLARGEFIQYLDSDDRLMPRKFELQVAALRANPECGIAYGMTRLVNDSGEVLAAPFKWTGEPRDTLFPGLLVDRWWCTHTPLYRRSVTDAIGEWSDLRYSQDWEYDARAGAMGVHLAYCPEYISEHHQHAGNRQTGSGKWLQPADRVRFLEGLFAHAVSAGISLDTAEMKHFVRWVFSQARACALLGDTHSAAALCALAGRARGGASGELQVFRALADVIGWARAARLIERARAALGRSAGADTQKQSWMNPRK